MRVNPKDVAMMAGIALASVGAGLQFGDLGGPFVVAQRAHACAHRAGSDQDQFPPGLALRGKLRHKLAHLRQIQLFAAVCQHARAQLDHQPLDVL